MKINQLSLFLENKPGQVLGVCRALKDASIDIRALTLADAGEFGILRLIASDWRGASKVLTERGYVVITTEVVAVEVPDRPGGLTDLLELLDGSGVNIEYIYTHTFSQRDSAVLICRFSDIDSAVARLQGSDINVISAGDIYQG
ncbi:MAG TPA: hypothetical protein VGK19_03685 [Capsulimonadaceae bacterium]|jgi:hypothetical protein